MAVRPRSANCSTYAGLQGSASIVTFLFSLRKSISAFTILSALFVLSNCAHAQKNVTDHHQLGLIDMAYVFKNYDKFNHLTEQLQAEIESTDVEMKAHVENAKKIQEQMKTFSAGSAEYEKLEGDLLNVQAELKKLQLKKQREFMKKEADLYKATYLEVREAVERYSVYYKYTLILRFDRSGVAAADNPQDVVEGLNQQVLYHRNRDDLTDPILNYLNQRWKKSQPQATAPASSTTK